MFITQADTSCEQGRRIMLHQDFEILSSIIQPFNWLLANLSTSMLFISKPGNPLSETDKTAFSKLQCKSNIEKSFNFHLAKTENRLD